MVQYLMAQIYAIRDEEGQGLVEYALIIALVAIAVTGALIALRGGIEGVFSGIVAAFGGV